MRAMTIQGSPRSEGCTGTLLREIEEELALHGFEVEHVEARDLGLAGCRGCGMCQRKPDEPGCVQKDGGNEFFGRLAGADLILFASPLYFWEFTAQLKSVIDRSLCLATGYMTGAHRSLVEGGRVALLLTCGGPERANTDEIRMVFRRYSVFLKATHAGELIVPFCTQSDQLKPGAKEAARRFARKLAGVEPEDEEELEDDEAIDEEDEGEGEGEEG